MNRAPLSIVVALLAGKPASPPQQPPQPMPSLAVVSRARIEVARESVVVIEEVTFSRGDWSAGDLDVYVAFGAPGVPRAFDAHLVAVPEGVFSAPPDDAGELLVTERSARKPDRALSLLGSSHMAGELVHMREPALRRAFAASGRVTLRVRSLVALPTADAEGAREVVVRLGTQPSPPLALAAIEIAPKDAQVRIDTARAQLCGAEADGYPLAVAGAHAPSGHFPAPTSPLAVARHASDDLCVKWTSR